ncbi:MAG: DUF5939 domain-containing protein [Neomegalonema sp.]|nr:DUF5939 domain-containing protein [Neomegalonema sp.]
MSSVAISSNESITESWDFRLSQSPLSLWPLLADTNRINEALDLPRYALAQDKVGGLPRAHSLSGFRGQEWLEIPHEWVAGQWWRFERRYLSGPLYTFSAAMALSQSEAGGSRVRFAVQGEPNGVLGRTLISSGYLRRLGDAFHEAAEDIDAFVSGRRPLPFPRARKGGVREVQVELDGRAAQMEKTPYDNGVAAQLASMIAKAPDSDLGEIRARRLARALDLSEREAAEACLAACDAGLLETSFSLLCPRCRRQVARVERLADLPKSAHCAIDAFDFESDLAVNVEALFRPAPIVRKLPEGAHCHSGPMAMPHVLTQQRLEPGEQRAIAYDITDGAYRVRAEPVDAGSAANPNSTASVLELNFDFDRRHAVDPGFPIVEVTGSEIRLGQPAPAGSVILENQSADPMRLVLERRAWRADALTAAETIILQAYRDLKGRDAPRWPMRSGRAAFVAWFDHGALGIIDQAEARGALPDPRPGWARKIAQLARSCNGGVVRQGGSFGLAAFLDPRSAARFTAGIRDLEQQMQASEAEPTARLAMAITGGRAFAVPSAQGLDFSGSSAALAETVLRSTERGEMLFQSNVFRSEMLTRLMPLARIDEVELNLPGLEKPVRLLRLR